MTGAGIVSTCDSVDIVPSFPAGEVILSARSAGDTATRFGGLFDRPSDSPPIDSMPIASRSVWAPSAWGRTHRRRTEDRAPHAGARSPLAACRTGDGVDHHE